MTQQKLKKCTKCNEDKELIHFYKNKSKKQGIENKCKECTKKKAKSYYNKNKESILKLCKIYRDNNPEIAIKSNKKSGKKRSNFRITNPEESRRLDKEYREKNKEKLCKNGKRYRENNKDEISSRLIKKRSGNKGLFKERSAKYYLENKDRLKKTGEYKVKNKLKIYARKAINNAIRTNEIYRPETCSICPSPYNIEGHHYDYSKPLDVIWLCSSCHSQIHTGVSSMSIKKRNFLKMIN